jgi:hypothetical protein
MIGRKVAIWAACSTLFVLFPTAAQAWTSMDSCGLRWPASSIPVPYRVNQNPPGEMNDIDQIRRIFSESFDTWSDPCCSSFAASDQGTTSATGQNSRDGINTASFIESDWPSSLGSVNSTLGVTMPFYDGRCNILGADVVFNSTGFSFVEGSPRRGNEADLGAIATHEFGHFLGLGHSSVFEATMYAAYTGGVGARSLHGDDEEGVCTLYEQSCTCTGNADCDAVHDCIDGLCVIPPCYDDGDCDEGLECNTVTGDCIVPPCLSNSDCVPGYECDAGVCVPDADCPICGACSTNQDCGASGVCIPAGYIGSDALCTRTCADDADCPGNTDCFTIPTREGNISLCFNTDAASAGPCPSDFVCIDDTIPQDPCDDVVCPDGQSCNSVTGHCEGGDGPTTSSCAVCEGCSGSGGDECGPGATCLDFARGPSVCSIACDGGGGCPGNSQCFQLNDAGGETQNWCLNDNAASAGICPEAWSCVEVVDSLCDGVECDPGESCNPASGACEGGGGSDGGGGFDGGVNNPDGGGGGEVTTGGSGVNEPGSVGCCTVAAPSGTPFGVGLWVLSLLGLIAIRRRR